MFDNTIQVVLEKLAQEVPSLTEGQQALLEDPDDPVARKLLSMTEIVEDLPVEGDVEQFRPLLERVLRIEALHAEATLLPDDHLDPEIAQECQDRRKRAADWLHELELTVETW
jgi:hypothetical protein